MEQRLHRNKVNNREFGKLEVINHDNEDDDRLNQTTEPWSMVHVGDDRIDETWSDDLIQIEAHHSQRVRQQPKHFEEYEINLRSSIPQLQPTPHSDKDVYMHVPQGFSKEGETRVCKLKKSLYGLRQASQNWYQNFTKAVIKIEFQQSRVDRSLFTYKNGERLVVALIYVDDVILTGNDANKIQEVNVYFNKNFGMKDLGSLKYFLGIEVARSPQVNVLSQFVTSPQQTHMNAAERVLRYLKLAPGQGIMLTAMGNSTLEAYCDADWGGCQITQRSCTGYFITLGGSPFSWRTKKQTVVAKSSAKAKYRAMVVTVTEIVWLRWLLIELQTSQMDLTTLFCDNQAALHNAMNLVFHERTKHEEMDCYFVRERFQSREIMPKKISNGAQLADIFTKALGKDRFRSLLVKLGIADLHAPT
ncbi:UNVERIFIED_CONTAM: Retrovirus-related Pol polyprotein from transposon RE1 [Sesamum radiatum]|uniref:Retrovirus-related Pol polyprotein from transposon RE1 n=1 Tax=Sesamum radiatum TaxID=300843 RepID=A0AAW2QIL0_SESRA